MTAFLTSAAVAIVAFGAVAIFTGRSGYREVMSPGDWRWDVILPLIAALFFGLIAYAVAS